MQQADCTRRAAGRAAGTSALLRCEMQTDTPAPLRYSYQQYYWLQRQQRAMHHQHLCWRQAV
jgi:hypothetical protein